jgi:integrase
MKVAQPRPHEPIRVVRVKSGVRYRVVLDVGETFAGSRIQETTTHRTLTDAREHVTDVRVRLKAGTYVARNSTTLDAQCARWIESRRDVREVTRLGYASVLKPVRAHMGSRRVQDLRRSDVEALAAWLESDGGQRGRGVGHRTIVLALGTVRQVLAHAVAEGLIPANPAAGVKAPRRQRADARDVAVWTVADTLRFCEVADRDEWAAGWRLTLSGLRRSEVLGCRWPEVNLGDGLVTVEAGRVALDGHRTATDDPKSAASWRTVPVEAMHAGTVALLRSLSARQAVDRLAAGPSYEDAGYLLVDALGQPIRPEAYSDRFAALCRQAGLPLIRLHDVRHSVALMLHRAGQAPADAAALLGHSVAVHLATYVPRTALGAQTAATALGEVLGAAL